MGLLDQEQAIMGELKKLGEETEEKLQDSEELVEEIQEKNQEPEEEEEIEEIEEEVEEEEEEDGEEEAAEDEEEEDEDKPLTGAQFRHKIKAEKEARLRIERELQELKVAQARQDGRNEAVQKEAVVEEEVPDQEYEPEKFAIWKADKLEKKLEVMEATQSRMNAEREWERVERAHSKNNADYDGAKAFLIDNETKRQKVANPYATYAEIASFVKQEEINLVASSAQAGIMPTDQIEFLAYKAGYRPGEKKVATKKRPNIKNIKKNVKKNASLIGGSPAADSGDARSSDQLAQMGMREIDVYGRKKYETELRKAQERELS